MSNIGKLIVFTNLGTMAACITAAVADPPIMIMAAVACMLAAANISAQGYIASLEQRVPPIAGQREKS